MSANTIISVEDSDTDFLALQHSLQVAGVTNPVHRCATGNIAASCLLSDHNGRLAERASLILLDRRPRALAESPGTRS